VKNMSSVSISAGKRRQVHQDAASRCDGHMPQWFCFAPLIERISELPAMLAVPAGLPESGQGMVTPPGLNRCDATLGGARLD
jgi:hypothetical protein